MKLRTKLPLFLIPLVIGPLVIVSWLALERMRSNGEENVLRQMTTLIHEIAMGADNADRTMKANALLFSGSGLLKNYIFTPDEDRYHFALLPLVNLFASYHNAYPAYKEIRFILPDGYEDARFADFEAPNKNEDESQSRWFRNIQESNRPTVSSFEWNPDTLAPVMMVAHRLEFVDPTFEDSTAIEPSHRGYLVITVGLDRLKQQIINTDIGKSGGILIFDPGGRPLYPDAQRMQIPDTKAMFDVAESAVGKNNTVMFQIDREKLLIRAVSLPGGLTLVGYLPERELVQASKELGRTVVVIGLMAVLLSTGMLMQVLQYLIVRPLGRLGAGAQSIGSGKFDTRIAVTGHDEVALLAGQFNSMAQGLVESHRLRNEAQAEALELKESAIESLKAADRLKDEFLANTSHELRTPLHGITGLAESLLGGIAGPVPAVARDNLSLIIASGQRLSNLVNDILDFSKLKHRALKLALRPVDLKSACDLVISMVSVLAEPKELTLANRISTDLPQVMADENRLHQILYNLVGNAVKFTSEGQVAIEAFAEGEMIRIQVEDTGIGVPECDREIIFKSFEQLDSGLDRAGTGTGLGLAITKKLIESHGGTIEVLSKGGGGSVFAFTLPYGPRPQRREDSTSPGLSAIGANGPNKTPGMAVQKETWFSDTKQPAGKKEHILVVDDEAVNLRVIENHLRINGFKVSTATSGAAAMVQIEKSADDLDLVLLDVMMPGKSGFEVCESIRKIYRYDFLPVIFLTALTRDGDLEQGFSVGGNDYIPKPFSYTELLARINLHLLLSRQSRDLHTLNAELDRRVQDRTQALERAYADMERLANLDGLTGVNNRRALDGYLAEAWERTSLTNGNLSYAIMDLDNFKAFNDTYGHQDGDDCLHAVAQAISRMAEKDKGFAGRYGGEEFCLILERPLNDALEMVKAICKEIRYLAIPHSGAATGLVTLSAGVSARDNTIASPEDLIHAADKSLYLAKERGRNRVEPMEIA